MLTNAVLVNRQERKPDLFGLKLTVNSNLARRP
jgi:hypothetical protein